MSVARLNSHLLAMQCPPALRGLDGWVLWRYEAGDGPKPRKVPYYADGGRRHGVQGRREDRLRMVKFDAALSAAARRGFDGIGLCLLPEFGVVCIDFDNVIDAQGLRPDVADLVSDTYAEFSPGGNGAHAWYLGNAGNHKSHGQPFGLEAFSSSGFVTFTGNALPHVADLELAGPVDLVPMGQGLRNLCAARFGPGAAGADVGDDDPLMNYQPPLGLTEQQLREALEVLDPGMGHDQWRDVGMALHHETGGDGFHLWDEWSAGGGDKYPGTEVLQRRWDSFGHRGGRQKTAATLIKMANAAGARIRVGAEVVTAEQLAAPAAAPPSSRFAPVSIGDLMSRARARWLVKHLLPETGVGIVFGPSMAGKSFLLLDLCLAIVRGVQWRGKRVRLGSVAYILAEGASGFPDRLRAYSEFHGADLADVPLHVIPAAPNLLEKGDVKELVGVLKALAALRLIVVDTIAQTTPGADENSSQDMGRAMAHAQAIAQATGALVLLVGHTGKDETKGLRGWSGMLAAFDVALQLERDGDLRQVTVVKQKDGPGEGDEYPFHLNSVTLGQDEDGDDITSCVALEGAADGSSGRVVKAKGVNQAVLLHALGELTDLGGAPTTVQLLDAARELIPLEPGAKDRRRDALAKALGAMERAKVLRITPSGLVEGF